MKLKELIQVPPITTVIQLADTYSTDQAKLSRLLTSFVVTEEIEFNLKVFLEAIAKKEGMGFFLTGHYGTGKSHFLAVLSILLKHHWSWPLLKDEIFTRFSRLKGRKFLVVKSPLHLYGADSTLEEIILSSLQKQLGEDTQKQIVLAHQSALLSNFNRYILPRHLDFYSLTELDKGRWMNLVKENPDMAASAAMKYLTSLESIPIRISYQRQEAFKKLEEYRQAHGYDGILLFVDELSEFLRSKPTPASFNEDIRFLQYLGELSTRTPLWIMASLQEGIEETGHIHQDLFNRIKDRYPKRLSLSSKHITELISKRLILKRPNAAPAIKEIYSRLREDFPGFEISLDNFIDIYPVHPDTLKMLEGLMKLFSQHRGVVDYIHHQIKGDPDRKITGMLNKEAEHLLAPDTIFDHFKERIREMVEVQAYYNVAYKYFYEQIPQIFKDKKAEALAMRLIKIMILTEISPLEDRHTARELTEMLLCRASSLEAGINYAYIREAILEPLLREASYIKSIPAEDPLDTVYYLDLEANASQIIAHQTKDILRGLQETNAWGEILKMVNPAYLPLSDLLSFKIHKSYIKWQNSTRQGRIILRDLRALSLSELQSLYDSLSVEEVDFVLAIGLPMEVKEQIDYIKRILELGRIERLSKLVLVWLPAEIADKEPIMTAFAHLILRKRLAANPETKDLLKLLDQTLEKDLARVREIVVEAYWTGEIFNLGGRIKTNFKELGYLPLEKMLAAALNEPLSEAYPKHKEIMPYTDTLSQHITEMLFSGLVVPGKITLKQAKESGLANSIEGVMLPLKVAKRSGNNYLLSVDPAKNEFLANYLAYILPGQLISASDLYLKLRKGPYGLTKPLFILTTSLLIHTGYLTPYHQGRIVHFNSVDRLYSGGVDEFGEGRLIEADYQPLLSEAEFVFSETQFSPFSLSLQKQLWEACIRFKEETTTKIEETGQLIDRYQEYASFKRLALAEIKSRMDEVLEFCSEIKTSYDSKQGLERMLEFLKSHLGLPARFRGFSHFADFLKADLSEYNQIHNYLTHPKLFIPSSSSLKQRQEFLSQGLQNVGGTILDGEFESFKTEAYQFIDEFRQEYTTCHHEFYSQDYFDRIRNIKETFEYGLLRKLSGISLVSVENDLVKIEMMLQAALNRCRRDPGAELSFIPICGCGYRLGQRLEAETPEKIMGYIQAGIREYALAFTRSEYREKLEPYMHGLSKLGRHEELANLNKLLELPVDDPGRLITDLRYLLTGDLTLQVNKALNGQVLVVERDLDELIDRLSFRRFSRQDLILEVEGWIDKEGRVQDDAYIQVKKESRGQEISLDRYGQTAREIIAEEGSRFEEAFWLACCLAQHRKAVNSLLLTTGYHIDLKRVDRIAEVGDRLLSEGAQEEIKRVEQQLNREMVLRELRIPGLGPPELLEILEREAVFEFVSREAALVIVGHLLSERGHILKELSARLKIRDDWAHTAIISDVCLILNLLASQGFKDVVKEYVERVSPLNFAFERLLSFNFREELLSGPALSELEKELSKANKRFDLVFAEGRDKILGIDSFLTFIYQPYRKKYEQKPVCILILDGMRWDTYEYLLPGIKKTLPGHKLAEVIPLRAIMPTTTPGNRKALLTGKEDRILGEDYIFLTAAERSFRREEVTDFLRGDAPVKVINFNLIDDRIHGASTDLYSLYQGLSLDFTASVAPHFKELSGHLLFILSDHGFTYTRQSPKPYSHGGPSAFESIVPASIWLPEE